MELWHGDKWNKTLAAKKRADVEGLSIREMEHHMDINMFLDRYVRSLHHPPRDVSTCCQAGAEGGRMNDPLGPLTQPSKFGPPGRCLHHLISETPD